MPIYPKYTGEGSYDWFICEFPTLRCKHGVGFKCERCGTRERTDANHTTRGGVGEIGRLQIARPIENPPRRGTRRRDARRRDRRVTIR